MRTLRLLSWLLLRPWRHHPVRQALTIFSIGLGVALYLSTELTLGAIGGAVKKTQAAIAAQSDLVVTHGSAGVSAAELRLLAARPEFASVAALVQATATTSDGRLMTLLGIDPAQAARRIGAFADSRSAPQIDFVRLASDPRAIVLTRSGLAWLSAELGKELVLTVATGRERFVVAGVVEVEETVRESLKAFAFLSLSAAQKLFGKRGKHDRVDLELAQGVSSRQGRAAVLACVAPGSTIVTPAEGAEDQIAAIGGFRAMLVLEGLLALLVALFFVYNAVSAAVAERIADAGLLRCIGITRGGLLALLLLEAAASGLLGLGLGIMLGVALGKAALSLMVRSVGLLYFRVPDVTTLHLSREVLLFAGALSVGLAVVAALLASRPLLAPRVLDFLRPVLAGRLQLVGLKRSAWLGALLLVTALAIAACATAPSRFPTGRTVSLLLPAGVGLIAPLTVVGVAGWLRRTFGRRVPLPLALALDATRAHPARTAMTITAFALSLGLVIGHGGVATAMIATLQRWLVRAIPGDLILGAGFASPTPSFPFEASSLDRLRSVPGVVEVIRVRLAKVRGDERSFMCFAIDMKNLAKHSSRDFVAGDPDDAYRRCAAGEAALVSENLAFKAGLVLGGEVTIPARNGKVALPIAGILRDYNSPLGTVMVDYALYVRLFEDELVDFGELVLAAQAKQDLAGTVSRVRKELGESFGHLYVLPKESFIAGALAAVEEVNSLSFVQLILASVIGSIGIIVTVSLSVLSRRREIALLRAVGMDKRMVAHTVLCEVAGLALAAALVGFVIGNVVFVPANLVFREFAGFSFPFTFPVWHCLLALAIAGLTALVSAIVPLRGVVKLDLLQSTSEE